MKVIPGEWAEQVELKELICDLSGKLFQVNEYFRML